MASSGDEFGIWGVVAIVVAVFCYGSYFVPVKKYEIHDGIVYQWYQCSGIMLAGIACALVRNDWAQTTTSTGFLMVPEGLLSGVIFQVANIIATISVKSFGLGNYYTVHQVTNLGVTFVVGVFGPNFGLPATPPTHVGIAALGFICVLVGMMPVMFMEKEMQEAGPLEAGMQTAGDQVPNTQVPNAASGTSLMPMVEEDGSNRLAMLFSPEALPDEAGPAPGDQAVPRKDDAGPARLPGSSTALDGPFGELSQLGGPTPRGVNGFDASGAVSSSQREVQISFGRFRPPPVTIPNFRGFNANTWDGTLGRPRLGAEEPAEPLTPWSCLGSAGLVVKEAPEEPEVPGESNSPLSERLLQPERSPAAALRLWMQGFLLSLLAGALYAGMYVPLLPWKERMRKAGVHVQGYDSFFSMCVGLYVASTAYLLCGGAWKKYRGQRMEKSVLRPALLSGVIYASASFCFLYAMMIIPYAIGYALGVGGGLAVSLLWGTLAFGEASSPYNRRCVVCSFVGVCVGIVLLGLSA
mmetsp:Transcript_11842/g.33461  ORF Transcript_11842/g.33461 Transcript_11842/m.33461 type:complete len:523 (+) Transcript_11842:32-1600(+)